MAPSPLRLLHTSDWHLGASTGVFSRAEDHRRLLDDLLAILSREPVDALVIAGDVFDHAQPSHEALALYFETLERLGEHVHQVIVVGGNHDSASQLDAPKRVLARVRVHVVGGLSRPEEALERCLCPVLDPSGAVLGVVAAVPFVPTWRLGVSSEHDDGANASLEALRALYTSLADAIAAQWPGVPAVATGHLAVTGSDPGDAPREIGMLEAVHGALFDPRFRYVALGHIHRAYRVEGTRAWYAGSPVPLSARESQRAQAVLRVTIPQDARVDATVEKVDLPRHRRLVDLIGTPEEVTRGLAALRHEEGALPALVSVRIPRSAWRASVRDELFERSRSGAAAWRLVDVGTYDDRESDGSEGGETRTPRLDELTEEQVFEKLCERHGETLDDGLRRLFREVLHETKGVSAGGAT